MALSRRPRTDWLLAVTDLGRGKDARRGGAAARASDARRDPG
uniref:Uncharacterized protein n=1 Tax=Human herpesvirus 2 TaxID=10310 RepID=A0A481TC98_HHV2|nr:hypothetical protein [Human alphaherpesvirus 2]QBH79947.1 hypothetical protein [Human alphaherpesvirus 2]QBH84566.1 hypothetical protein [Human alphaherpesvirus 2]QBH85206.1 hypothetical protein [Human alphaherpesvirus 2]